jgi:peptidoglycan/xylan/chitin deacetylase (PgdA/CDA1 family)
MSDQQEFVWRHRSTDPPFGHETISQLSSLAPPVFQTVDWFMSHLLILCFIIIFDRTGPGVQADSWISEFTPRQLCPQSITSSSTSVMRDSMIEAGGIRRGPVSTRRIALTFDACPSTARGGYDDAIVRILLETRTPATFFLGGRWAKKHPGETRFLARQAIFAIGSHGYSHEYLSRLADSDIVADLQASKRVLGQLTGKRITLFRPPYAEADRRLAHIADSLGLTTIVYDVAPGDPDSAITASRIIDYVSSRGRNGSIVIMHVNGRGWHTAEALPGLITRLQKKGFSFVTVPTLLGPDTSDVRRTHGHH